MAFTTEYHLMKLHFSQLMASKITASIHSHCSDVSTKAAPFSCFPEPKIGNAKFKCEFFGVNKK